MARPGLNWRNAQLPPHEAVFAIGDIHAHTELLSTLLGGIKDKIAQLPKDISKVHIIGIGDYIDRGKSAPDTINMLLQFKQEMESVQGRAIGVHYLCGNHDELFKRLLETKGIADAPVTKEDEAGLRAQGIDPNHVRAATRPDGTMPLEGLEGWLFSGGGITTLRDYRARSNPPSTVDDATFNAVFNTQARHIDRARDPELAITNTVIRELQQQVPEAHKEFFRQTYDHTSVRVGDFLFTHAGVDPDKSLERQGLAADAPLSGPAAIKRVDIRNAFLWRERLDNCPYIVVHGHTPSAIPNDPAAHAERASDFTLVDPQKDYRLNLDTSVNDTKHGALTAMVHDGRQMQFMAVKHSDPTAIVEYSITPQGQELAQAYHQEKHPQYHPGGKDYCGGNWLDALLQEKGLRPLLPQRNIR